MIIEVDFKYLPGHIRVETTGGYVTRFCENCFLRFNVVAIGKPGQHPSIEQFLRDGNPITESTPLRMDCWDIVRVSPCEWDQFFCRACNHSIGRVSASASSATIELPALHCF